MADIYEGDLRDVSGLIERLKACTPYSDLYIEKAVIEVRNRHDYPVGTLTYEEEQWCFTPYEEASS